MRKIITWLNEKFTPKVNKLTENVWVKSLQRTMIATLPMILIGTVINILSSLRPYFPFLPDLSLVYYYTFYLLGLYVAVMIPYYVTEGKKLKRVQLVTVITTVGVFLMMQRWNLNPYGETSMIFTNLGPQGIVLGIVTGYYVSYVMCKLAKFSFFKKDTSLPTFVTSWFDQMLPIFICFVIPFLIVYVIGFDILAFITLAFTPLGEVSNTLVGFVLINFLYVFFYSIGASGWILSGAFYPILMTNMAANTAAVAAGNPATAVALNEVIYAGWCAVGGLGSTLTLACFMLKSKSKRLRGVAKGCIIPSICNINEPLVYGTPIVLNPILMIPMWINAIIIPTIVYFTLTGGMVTIPSKAFSLGFIPSGITAYMVNYDFRSLILLVVVIVVSAIVWYPFFKSYETQEIKKENEAEIAGE